MMAEYEFIFANRLRYKIIDQINGCVKTWVTDNTLHVGIRLQEYNIQFEYTLPNFSDCVLHNLTTDYVVYEVIREYKTYLHEKIREKLFK